MLKAEYIFFAFLFAALTALMYAIGYSMRPGVNSKGPQVEWYSTPYGVCTNVENGKLCKIAHHGHVSIVYIPNN